MINKVLLIGRTPAKPSLKEGKTGTKYCSFSVATNSGYGENKKTDWHDITAFNNTAEKCAQYIEKGTLVLVEGRISYDKYEKDGKTVKTTKIIADYVTFLSGKSNVIQNGNGESKQIDQALKSNPPEAASAFDFGENDVTFDDVPF